MVARESEILGALSRTMIGALLCGVMLGCVSGSESGNSGKGQDVEARQFENAIGERSIYVEYGTNAVTTAFLRSGGSVQRKCCQFLIEEYLHINKDGTVLKQYEEKDGEWGLVEEISREIEQRESGEKLELVLVDNEIRVVSLREERIFHRYYNITGDTCTVNFTELITDDSSTSVERFSIDWDVETIICEVIEGDIFSGTRL